MSIDAPSPAHVAHALLVEARRDWRHAASAAQNLELRLVRLEAALLPAIAPPPLAPGGELDPEWAGKVAAALIAMRGVPGSKQDVAKVVSDVRAVTPTASAGTVPANRSARAAAAASAALRSAPVRSGQGTPT